MFHVRSLKCISWRDESGRRVVDDEICCTFSGRGKEQCKKRRNGMEVLRFHKSNILYGRSGKVNNKMNGKKQTTDLHISRC